MAYAKVEEIRKDVIKSLGEVEGVGVQLYSESRIDQAIIKIFTFLIQKIWWPDYMLWQEHELDGELGIITDDGFKDLQDYSDIRAIIPEDHMRAIPQMPDGINPFSVTGTYPRYMSCLHHADSNYQNRRVQFWPKAATSKVFSHARFYTRPGANTTIYMDRDLVGDGATWSILNDEDVNPGAAEKWRVMFDTRWKDLQDKYASQPIRNPRDMGRDTYPHEWVERPW